MKIKNIFKIFASFLLVFFMIFYTEQVTSGAYSALGICATSVIPALFPFFVVSGILVNTGMAHYIGKILEPVAKKLFKTSGTGAFCFVIGILCGYPTGAKVIVDMYKACALSKKESERLLAFCNNSGPLFVIGTVGVLMLNDKRAGIILYVIHVLSAIITGMALSLFQKRATIEKSSRIIAVSLEESITKSMESAVKSILLVCGYVVFFGSVISVFGNFIKNPILLSLIEVTTGAKIIASAGNAPQTTLALLSATMAFGGICVLLQVKSVIQELSVRMYVFGKIFQSVCAFAIMKLYLSLNNSVFTFSSAGEKIISNYSYIPLVFFFVSGLMVFLIRLTKRG